MAYEKQGPFADNDETGAGVVNGEKLTRMDNGIADANDPQNLLTALKTVDGSGSGLDADTVDGVHAGDLAAKVHGHAVEDVSGLEAQLADKIPYDKTKYATHPAHAYFGDTTVGGVKIKLPCKADSELMLSFAVTIYATYRAYKLLFSGYFYAYPNQWYEPRVRMIVGENARRIVMGKYDDGTPYVWIEGGMYCSVHISEVYGGFGNRDWNTGWVVISDNNHQNVALDKIVYPPVTQSALAMQPTELRTAMMLFARSVPDEQALEIPSLFPAWDGAGVDYTAGARVTHDGGLYKCLTAHASQPDWAPGAAPSLWVRLDSPDDAWPLWRQPQGAHDAYAAGAQVSHADRHWVSETDGNVWEPGIYGWTESTTKGDT